MAKANFINHHFYILDASTSMKVYGHTQNVIKVTDALISHLASQVTVFPDQENRVTVYAFSSESYLDGRAFQCLIWDKDVLRVPSIAGIYSPHGNTAMTATVMQVIEDMKSIPVTYGDHIFLCYLVTDGEENHSDRPGNLGLEKWYGQSLTAHMQNLPDTWTMAALVPGAGARNTLIRYGYSPGNIEIWDPSKKDAVLEVGERLRATTDAVSAAVASPMGYRSSTSLFSMAAPPVQTMTAGMIPMTPGSYYFIDVDQATWDTVDNGRIDQFVAAKTGHPYVPDGKTYYQMTKRERIQHYKQLAVVIPDHQAMEASVYVGQDARMKLGLPAPSERKDVRVSPGSWKGYKVFVATTSFNRKLVPGSKLLVMR